MRGVGPMLPVVVGKERLGRSSSIWNLRRNKRTYFPKNPSEPALSDPTSPPLKRDSGVETSDESTSVSVSSERSTAAKSSEWSAAGASSKDEKSPSSEGSHHRRDPSLILNFDVEHAAQQVRNDEISDLDLALFAFWIRAKDENYFTARKLIRELALDQGYNVNKITNACIRKLLQDLHDIRPRDPRHTLTPRGSFLSQTSASNARASYQTIVPLSPHTPHTPRIESLPQSLRLRREYAVEEAAQPCSPTYDITEYGYPPNTPDRPAPLSVKLRNSQDSDRTITPKTIFRGRSSSAPITPETARETLILPPTYHCSPKQNHSPTKHQRSSGVNDTVKGTTMESSDVFDHASASSHTKGTPFTDRLESGDRRYGGLTSGKHTVGPYQLDASDAASVYSNDTIRDTPRRNNNRAGEGVGNDGSIIEDSSFDTLEAYSGTDNDWEDGDTDKHSLLENASVCEAGRSPTKYRYGLFPKTTERSSPKKVRFASPEITGTSPVKESVPTPPKDRDGPRITERSKLQEVESASPKRNIASELDSLARNFKLSVAGGSLQQQRPLRRYESEANLSSNAGFQAASEHVRVEFVASTADDDGQAADVQHPHLSPSYKTKAKDDEEVYYGRISCRSRIPEPVSRGTTSTRQHVTNGPPLSAFPIPPMSNPVGELPMLLSRATEVPRDEEQTASQYLMQDTSIAKAEESIATTVKRTQARGLQLPIIEWESIPKFEQVWREQNKRLLVTIFGRKDTKLEVDDYNYIDWIATQLRNDRNVPNDWVKKLLGSGRA